LSKYAYNISEQAVRGYIPNRSRPDEDGIPILSFPCTPKEAVKAMYRRESVWLPYGVESGIFCPEIIPDNIARGFVVAAESKNYTIQGYGGCDMFGVEWVYEAMAHGSMEKPGNPHLLEGTVCGWKDKLVFPDIDSWDWDKSARDNREWLDNGKANFLWLLNGMGFERLISFMGFEGAAMALIDEEQEEELLELLEALTDLHIRIVDRVCDTYGDAVDGFTLHDDWGSQMAPLFSLRCAEKFFVPQMRRFTGHVKSRGKIADLHSCGHIEDRIESIIRAGWQSWTPMAMNDTLRLQAEYGDKIIIGCVPGYDRNKTPEENAACFVSEHYSPEKPCTISVYGRSVLTEEYTKVLYRFSREMN